HGRGAGEAGGGDVDGAVDRAEHGLAREVAHLDLAVDAGGDEPHALRDAHPELDHDIVVPDVAAPAAGLALVGRRRAAARVDGADGDAIAVRDDLDGHALGVAPARAFDGRDLDGVAGRALRPDAPVAPPDLDGLAALDAALPLEVGLLCGEAVRRVCERGAFLPQGRLGD